MSTEANFPLRWLCLKPLYGRFSLDHLWPFLRDHRGFMTCTGDSFRFPLLGDNAVSAEIGSVGRWLPRGDRAVELEETELRFRRLPAKQMRR